MDSFSNSVKQRNSFTMSSLARLSACCFVIKILTAFRNAPLDKNFSAIYGSSEFESDMM